MKNFNLIYLIPAMMMLVWGCTSPKEPKEPEGVTVDSIPVVLYTCPVINDSLIEAIYNQTGTHAATQLISSMASDGSNNIAKNVPNLFAEEISDGVVYSLFFRLVNNTLSSSSARVKVITDTNGHKVLVISLEAIQSAGPTDNYYKIKGDTKSLLSPYSPGDIDAVVAVIKYVGPAGIDFNFSVNQLQNCISYASDSSIADTMVRSYDYNHGIEIDAAPHAYTLCSGKNKTLDSLRFHIPLMRGFSLTNLNWKKELNGKDVKIIFEADVVSSPAISKSTMWFYKGNLRSDLSIPDTLSISEVEIIINNTNTSKKVKIIRTSSDSQGIVKYYAPTDSTYTRE